MAKKTELKNEESNVEMKSEVKEVKTPALAEAHPEQEAKPADDIKEVKNERPAIVYIYTSSNNTMVHMTDLSGNTISRVTGGMITKHSRLKSDPTIAMFIAKKAAERAKDLGITSLYARTRARTGSDSMGSAAHAVVKAFDKEGFKIISIVDTTRVARGGPKKKGGKRGRRV